MSDTVTCRNCGFVNTASDEFCGNCGRFLEWSTEPGGAAEGTAPPAAS
ncbi:MAG: zinc ribbon domain-containing protein, partial [Chloroflexi bacterium]|nr:zinc ribbon domain-containing protein [Chloroflexota bacterium]